ncbi:MAG: hypothetical protein O7D91_08030 [Planctomycetota bacterium]|nr:hypothetical protein [Planctomycetota bacterium]
MRLPKPPHDGAAEDRQDAEGSAGESGSTAETGTGQEADPTAAGLAQPNFPNPSTPMTKSKAADKWGGDMTVDKLTSQMVSGKVKYRKLNRQTFIFCCDDVPNLEPAHKAKRQLAETPRNSPKLPK